MQADRRPESLVFVGTDVAEASLEVAARPTGEAWQVPHDEFALHDLVERVRALGPALIALEATSGVQVPVVTTLAGRSARRRTHTTPGS